jgi:uncharacterized protein YjiS (DUF1127 family)
MAFFSETPSAQDRPAFFAKFFAGVMAFFDRLMIAQSRTTDVDALRALTDRELSDLGIARQDIVRHVYRDVYYL